MAFVESGDLGAVTSAKFRKNIKTQNFERKGVKVNNKLKKKKSKSRK